MMNLSTSVQEILKNKLHLFEMNNYVEFIQDNIIDNLRS